MQVVPSFEGNGSPYGAFRVLGSIPDMSPRNSSHYQELYQNLPQLQKTIVLPISYRSYEAQNQMVPVTYAEQQKPTAFPPFYNRVQTNTQKYQYGKHHQDQDTEILNKRNDYGYGGYAEAPSHGQNHGSSPALSALALLGFMFFLQLIQNSLQNNRQLLAAAALSATAQPAAATGRKKRRGGRQRRNTREDKGISTTPNYMPYDMQTPYVVQNDVLTTYQNHAINATTMPFLEKYDFTPRPPKYKKIRNTTLKNTSSKDLIEILRSSSIHCCQLIACKLGETIYDKLDKTTGFMVRMLGTTMISRIPKKTWTGRLLRAVDKGWKKESCDSLFRNCGVLYKLFYNTTNTIQTRRKRKMHTSK